jgi:hypothetical protein
MKIPASLLVAAAGQMVVALAAAPASGGGSGGKGAVVTPHLPDHPMRARDNARVNLPGYNATDLYSGCVHVCC